MGKIDYFTINLQKPDRIYYTGETIIGDVKLKVNERLQIKCLKCVIKGSSYVAW